MKKLIGMFAVLAMTVLTTGCAEQRRVTTTRESVQTVPADPVVTEQRTTTTHTEVHH